MKKIENGRGQIQKNFNIGSCILKAFIIIILIIIITGCIVVSLLSIYFLNLLSGNEALDLDNYKVNYTTIIYANDKKTGEPKEIQRIFKNENRIWIDIDKMPKYLMHAVIAIEDQRYLEHKGVDWKRTAGAFLNEFLHIYGKRQGGSTITQQLIKNITQKNEVKYQRKIREILEAIYLEKNYSKEQIIEAYLNIVYFGNGANGIQAAANTYFNKDAKDLSLIEAASIVGITQNPAKYNPFKNYEENKNRRNYILKKMLDLGLIKDEDIYKKAVEQDIELVEKEIDQEEHKVQSYFVDNLIEEIIDDLVEEKGYTRAYAEDQLFSGGFKIYSTVDTQIQNHLEKKFEDDNTFPVHRSEIQPQSAMVILDPNGKILGLVGGRGKKEAARIYNRATQAKRQPGSTIKPIAVYGPAIEYDLITYSSILEDSPIEVGGKKWPVNYYGSYYGNMTVDRAVQISNNTLPVKICRDMTPIKSFNFLTKKLKMTSLIEEKKIDGRIFSDINLSGMALGGVTEGIRVLELAGAYQIYANGGYFTKPYSYTKILDSKGNLILEKDIMPTSVISPETSMIMNQLLQRVINGPSGTGRAAKFGSMPLAGKTGSTSDDKDLWFVGMSPYYIGVVWYGYDNPKQVMYGQYPTPVIWKKVMEPLHANLPVATFPVCSEVIKAPYCAQTGHLAGPYCPVGGEGYYKSLNKSLVCTSHVSPASEIQPDQENQENQLDQKISDNSPENINPEQVSN
ncbi:MAG: PBP1A family penicillin-binding protein [Oscillospiraceae bacterium]|nr:PBP1A family penicillin-binding protein [Oscillospiraceae bacterium]